MLIFYSKAQGRENVPAKSPVHESFENTISIFRSLDQRGGFLGIVLKEPFILQLMTRRKGVRIELLDTSIPAFDAVDDADPAIAEQLISAAAAGLDVFQIARQTIPKWEHLDMS